MLSRQRTLFVPLALAAALALAPDVRAVTVAANITTAGPINVNDTFVVELSVSGWNANDGGVDSVSFFVDWNNANFSYVSYNLLLDGTEFLAEATQGGGYSASDDVDTSLTGLGRFIFGISDTGDASAGSIGGGDGAGILGTFTLQALQVGTFGVTPGAPNVNDIFGDTSFNGITPTGGVTLTGSSIQVIPEPSGSLLALAGGFAVLAGRRRRVRVS